ncbi:E3 ubiquitin-protein ligase PDZRN3-like isoform X2 [Haliotis rufescens]|uniref:E3 ubiquitin-protein ligase PDZRN3-like isoform X2 n=1 Tax=Haliotis rufescens TaxID=6454 RepID=UPI00201E9E8A|nr:E3 ubiquitin-protein ligase PDZRN3-like isoform X2 [Haliotis rufescens]
MGFDTEKFVNGITDDKKCALCHGVLDNPVRAPCHHVFCSGCILPWVVRHGSCPLKCQTLTPGDLENVLPLRQVILHLRVKCDFTERGCTEILRLTDLVDHTQECQHRPVGCSNPGCGVVVSHKDLGDHEGTMCQYRPVGVCQIGCGLVLFQNTSEEHDCVGALKNHINNQNLKVGGLEQEIKRISFKFTKREKALLTQVSSLHSDIQLQALRFQRKLNDYKNQLARLTKLEQEITKGSTEDTGFTVTLGRDGEASLGFNIMGGFTPENNNNQTVSDGIVVSRVTENGPADNNGLKTYDRIIKVNGQDLSQSSHEAAVEAFRTAKEPIVVEVLRRVNKNKMKNRSPTMVSIGTQTEEDFYCYNRPPTPPPGFYPLHVSGLYQPSSRRPVAFSPSADMGLTDIEMSHNLDFDDPYFDDRPYEMEYEEVVLHRVSSEEKLGLTLCYGSLEDEVTDIFISEIDPNSIAAKDGRIREGDQILQINGVDVHNRDQAIKLFSDQGADITLLVARPQLQCDDGFMDEHNMVLDDLHMDLLEKHHHDNMAYMAHMLARRNLDEEGGTTDTATTENSNKHEKDSGVGRTDESTKNDESSEQETFDIECLTPPTHMKFPPVCNLNREGLHHSNESVTSNEPELMSNDISAEACDQFRQVLQHRCVKGERSPKKEGKRKDSGSSIERELHLLNREMEEINLECQEIVDSHIKDQMKLDHHRDIFKIEPQKSPRIVPRMGTRLEYLKHVQSLDPSELLIRRSAPSMKMGQQNVKSSEREKDTSTTSAYNTGESCRSTPLTLELNQASDDGDRGFKNSMLCLAPGPAIPSSSDTEKQTQTPTKSRDYSSDDSGHGYKGIVPVPVQPQTNGNSGGLKDHIHMGESLQDLYIQYADVMYTNRANLEHTIAIQQKLFQQQMDQKHRTRSLSKPSSVSKSVDGESTKSVQGKDATQSESGAMEWVVKRRPDGTRYITRRPVRNKILKERAKKISEERCGMTTDDDAMSEMKTGRYWTKEERKRHLEKAKDYKKKKELMIKARMETLKEAEEKKEANIVELSHRKMNKHKGKKVLDNFVTVQEMLAHGSRVQDGKTYNPLLSVTTV